MHPRSVLAALIVSTIVVSVAKAESQPPPPAPPIPPAQEAPDVEKPAAQDPAAQQPADDESAPQDDTPEPTPRERRPYRGLFGGGQPYSTRGQALDLTISASAGFDRPIGALKYVDPPDDPDRLEVDGPFSGASAALVYTRPGKRLNLSAFGSTFVGYFWNNDEPWYPSSSLAGAAQTSFQLARRTHLELSHLEAFETDQQFGVSGMGGGGAGVPIASATTGFDTSIRRAPSIRTAPQATLVHNFSQRSSLRGFTSYQNLYFIDRQADPADFPNRHDFEAGFRFVRQMTRHLGLRAGYAHRRSFVQDGEPSSDHGFHDIDVGADYGRALSLARRTTFSFHTGSTISAGDFGNDTGDGSFSEPRIFVVGGAALSHEIGRSWTARADYTRDVGFEAGFTQPRLQDSVRGSINGVIGRRLDVLGDVVFTTAAYGLEDTNFRSWSASTQVRGAITRNLAAYAYYYYYLQDFDQGVPLPSGVVNLARHGVRVGLSTWFPIWSSRGAP